MEENNNYSLLYKLAKRLFRLKVEDARFVLAVKLTKLLGAIVYLFVGFMIMLSMLAFIALAVGHCLSNYMEPVWAYMIIAAFYLILLCAIVVAKRFVIMDPIARFISKLIVEPPHK
ncbi:MAG: phage holin family protein [Clostridiales bacterium]|nr:phage holin family protein [Clostridiales bacterium]